MAGKDRKKHGQDEPGMIQINQAIEIPEEELSFTASRSGGPGGQNVNKVNTRVTLWFDVAGSPSLSAEQKQMLLTHLANRISNEGVLQIVSQQHRTQAANREGVVERFVEVLRVALTRPKTRHKTLATYSAKQRRLEAKRRRSDTKRQRSQKDLL
jgi:ribosome-associated protein